MGACDSPRTKLHEDVKHMTAGQRLAAFLVKCQLLAQLSNPVGMGPVHTGRKMPSETPRTCRDAQRGRACR